MVIIETDIFTALVTELLDDLQYMELQHHLIENPRAGDVIQGTGGIRKLRWGLPGRGKRGGARVIYYHADTAGQLRMLLIYAKTDMDDLSTDQKRALKKIVDTWN